MLGQQRQNGRAPDSTVQHTHGLLSCSEWTGVPLATLLTMRASSPPAPGCSPKAPTPRAMARSIPIDKAMDDALVVYGQNGELLRPEQGYPLRLLCPAGKATRT